MNRNDTLLIFSRNLVCGKVKTRLAETIGNDKAMQVYQLLIDHTFSVTKGLDVTRIVSYSEFAVNGDIWDTAYLKTIQRGADLGERMSNAFYETLNQRPGKAVIIGTDCYEIDEPIIVDAFEQLNRCDVVIGPALDGGYYLLGLKKHHHQLFKNMAWSTDTVLSETLMRCNRLRLTYFLLPVLNDIDDEQDLIRTNLLQKS